MGLLSASQISQLNTLMGEGWETLADWTTTDTITIARQDGTTGTYPVVSIRLAARQEQVSGAGTPVAGTTQSGTLRLWTANVTARPVRRGDRFVWNGQAAVISAIQGPQRGGVTEYAFDLDMRNT